MGVAAAVPLGEEHDDEPVGSDQQHAHHRHEHECEMTDGLAPDGQAVGETARRALARHAHHDHTARGRGHEIDDRDLETADGVHRRRRGLDVIRHGVQVKVCLSDLQGRRRAEWQRVSQLAPQRCRLRPQLRGELPAT